MNEKITDKKSFFSEWLEKLQQESWQLELLISGLALFGIWEAQELLVDFDNYISENVYHGILSRISPFILIILKVGWKIFFINLLIHVILRGLWIGSIGLRYISGDIDFDELNFSPFFTSYLKRRIGSYDDFIEGLERMCSVLFAYTFLLFLLFLSLVLFFSVIPIALYILKALVESEKDITSVFGIATMIYVFVGALVFIDFITVGAFKKIRDDTVSRTYSYIYRFYSTITLSFLYRPLLYNFLDNSYTKRLFYLSIPYIMLLSVGNYSFSNNNRPYFGNTDNLIKDGQIINTCNYVDLKTNAIKVLEGIEKKKLLNCIPDVVISQFYIDQSYPSIFFKMRMSDQELFKILYNIEPLFYSGLRFSLFGDERKEDSGLKNHLKNEALKLDEVRGTIKIYRDSLRSKDRNGDSYKTWNNRIDSLKNLRDDFISFKASEEEAFIAEKRLKILSTFQDFHELQIDNISYSDSLICHYYIHPDNNDVKGMLCHFNSEYLSKGEHLISIRRKIYNSRKEDSTDYKMYKFPFIKLNN